MLHFQTTMVWKSGVCNGKDKTMTTCFNVSVPYWEAIHCVLQDMDLTTVQTLHAGMQELQISLHSGTLLVLEFEKDPTPISSPRICLCLLLTDSTGTTQKLPVDSRGMVVFKINGDLEGVTVLPTICHKQTPSQNPYLVTVHRLWMWIQGKR
jgi:hypothetical protein